MGYESISVQCLQVDDVIPILLLAVYCGFGRCGSKRFTWWYYFLMYIITSCSDHQRGPNQEILEITLDWYASLDSWRSGLSGYIHISATSCHMHAYAVCPNQSVQTSITLMVRRKSRLHVVVNKQVHTRRLTHGHKHVHMRRQTRSHAVWNTFTFVTWSKQASKNIRIIV